MRRSITPHPGLCCFLLTRASSSRYLIRLHAILDPRSPLCMFLSFSPILFLPVESSGHRSRFVDIGEPSCVASNLGFLLLLQVFRCKALKRVDILSTPTSASLCMVYSRT